MEINEFSLKFMTIRDISWQLLTIQDNSWQFMTINDNSWQFLTIHDNSWTFMNMQRHSWLLPMIHDHWNNFTWQSYGYLKFVYFAGLVYARGKMYKKDFLENSAAGEVILFSSSIFVLVFPIFPQWNHLD